MSVKQDAYTLAKKQLHSILEEPLSLTGRMSTLVALLHHSMPHFDWTGFYLVVEPELLEIGCYQGGLACTRIPFSKGVCGAVAKKQQTIVVGDVSQFSGYIACDHTTRSEIVVPMFLGGKLFAVFDVDSNKVNAFDEIDAGSLRTMIDLIASQP